MLNAAGRKGWRYFCSFGRRVCISFSDSGKQRWREKMRRKWIRNRHSGCQVAVCLCMLVACLMMACCVSARALNTPPAGCSLRTKVTKEQYQFPLGTTAWRISEEYGWREDPLTGKEAFHKGVDPCLCLRNHRSGGGGRHCCSGTPQPELWQLPSPFSCERRRNALCSHAVSLCPDGGSRQSRRADWDSWTDRTGHRGTSPPGMALQRHPL